MCQIFEKDRQKDLLKLTKVSKSYFIKELAQGNSCQFDFDSLLESGIVCFITMSYNKNNLLVEILRSLCQSVLLCNS